jgi:hypothetical protein
MVNNPPAAAGKGKNDKSWISKNQGGKKSAPETAPSKPPPTPKK